MDACPAGGRRGRRGARGGGCGPLGAGVPGLDAGVRVRGWGGGRTPTHRSHRHRHRHPLGLGPELPPGSGCVLHCVNTTLPNNFASRGGNVREGLRYKLKIFPPGKMTF